MNSPSVAWINTSELRDGVYIPKYYGLEIAHALEDLRDTHELITIRALVESGAISVSTGHEIGKAAYGTGEIPFVRTSDIANWEIKAAPKQGVSRDIYEKYASRQNVGVGDILFVRDGTYLIGRNCFITDVDRDILFQSHVLKIKVTDRIRYRRPCCSSRSTRQSCNDKFVRSNLPPTSSIHWATGSMRSSSRFPRR